MANSNRTKGILPLVLGSLSIATGAAAADQDQSAAKTDSPRLRAPRMLPRTLALSR